MVTISDALFTKTQQRVLGLLYGKPDKSFIPTKLYARQPWVGGTIRREPERLSSAGLLKVSREGNQQHYQANPASPVYQELFNIVKKTCGIADIINTSLKPLEARIKFAFIYGSIAKGEDTASSDIDLLVLTDSLEHA